MTEEIKKDILKRIIATFHYKGLNTVEEVNSVFFSKPQILHLDFMKGENGYHVYDFRSYKDKIKMEEQKGLNLTGAQIYCTTKLLERINKDYNSEYSVADIERIMLKVNMTLNYTNEIALVYKLECHSVEHLMEVIEQIISKCKKEEFGHLII